MEVEVEVEEEEKRPREEPWPRKKPVTRLRMPVEKTMARVDGVEDDIGRGG